MHTEPQYVQPSLFPDVPIDRPPKRKPSKRSDAEIRPAPLPPTVWYGPRRDVRRAYDPGGEACDA